MPITSAHLHIQTKSNIHKYCKFPQVNAQTLLILSDEACYLTIFLQHKISNTVAAAICSSVIQTWTKSRLEVSSLRPHLLHKISKGAKIVNRYNQVPRLTNQGYKLESDKLTVVHHKREPRGQPFPSR